MKIAILTIGTRGDLELFLALAQALADQGHQVTVGTLSFNADRVRDRGIRVLPMGGRSHDEAVSVLRGLAPVEDKVARTREFYNRWLRKELEAAKPVLGALAGAADYFVSNLKLFLRRGTGRIPGAFVDYDPPIEPGAFARLGVENLEHRRTTLDLVALSRGLVDPDGVWDPRYRFTGFWRTDTSAGWHPPPGLDEFLSAGPPPVAVTMGSMAMFDSARLLQSITDAVDRGGLRAVVVGGWSGLGQQVGPRAVANDRLYLADEVPYAWLFPRAACVLHYGGTGTVAEVLSAGRPSVVIPQIACQEIFGGILQRNHLASAVLESEPADVPRLAAALKSAVSDPLYAASARHWQKEVRAERGLELAVELIESHADGLGLMKGLTRVVTD